MVRALRQINEEENTNKAGDSTATRTLANASETNAACLEPSRLRNSPSGPQPLDGLSLLPVLHNPLVRVRSHAYHVYPKQKLGRAIRTERYRLVEWNSWNPSEESPERELYDYQVDPQERRNLAADFPMVVRDLQAILDSYPAPVPR